MVAVIVRMTVIPFSWMELWSFTLLQEKSNVVFFGENSMNKSFKVVFNKARGALMVVNEVTSCVQAKGTKTVIAAAVAALAASGAMATEWVKAPEELKTVQEEQKWEVLKEGSSFAFVLDDKAEKKQGAFLAARTEGLTFDKDLWVSGNTSDAQATGISAVKVKATNTGRIFVTSGKDGVSYKNHGMMAENGGTAVNDGLIVAKNAYGMSVETAGPASTLINNNRIVVEETGVGMELGGYSGSKAENRGTIVVGTPTTGVDVEGGSLRFGHGVLIQDSSNNVFTNYGTIEAADGASAIEVKTTGTATAGNTLNFEAGSKVVGEVNIQNGVTGTVINANGFDGTIDLNNQSDELVLNVVKDAELTLEEGNKSKVAVANITDGRLNASIWGDDNKFGTVNLEENGVFNVKKLNSGGDKDHLDTDPHDTLLVHGSTWNLNGGELLVANGSFADGKMKVGTETATGEVNFNGDYTLSRLEIGLKGTVNVGKVGEGEAAGLPGTLTVKDLSFHYRGDNTETGSVTVNEDSSLVVTGTIGTENAIPSTVENKTLLTVKDGATVETSAANVFAQNENKTGYSYTLTDTWNRFVVTESGSTLMLSGINEFTNEDYGKYAGAVAGADLVLNGTLTDAGKQDLESIISYAGLNSTIAVDLQQKDAEDKTKVDAELKGDVGVGAIGVVAGTETITITGQKAENDPYELVVRGVNGKVVEGVDSVKTLTAKKLVLGAYETDKATVNADHLVVDSLDVVGDFTAQHVTVNIDGYTDNRFEVASLDGDGKFTVDTEGTLKVSHLAVKEFAMNQGSTLVLGDRLQVEQLETARAPEDDVQYSEQIATVVRTPNVDTIVTTNADGRNLLKAVAGDKYDAAKNVGLYVHDTIAVNSTAGKLLIGTLKSEGDKNFGDIALGSNSVTVIDVSNFSADKAIFVGNKLHVNQESTILLKGADRIGSFKLIEGGTVNDVNVVNKVLENGETNAWLGYTVAQGTGENDGNTILNVAFDQNATKEEALSAFAESVLTTGSESLGVINAIGTVYNDNGTLSEVGEEALYEYMALPVVAGTYNAAYDAAEQVWNTVGAHNIDRTAGKTNGVWADVFYSANEAGDMYGNGYGYEADVYGGVLGYDYTAACGGKIGAALTIGTSDVDAKGDFIGDYGNDADFWGLSIYASKDITEKMIVSADITYLSLDNDIKGSVAGASVAESIDSSVISVGLRADWKAYESNAFEIVPHAGIRYAQIDVDDYREMDGESLDVLEMPVGVAFNGKFEAAGMKFVPTLDFTVVPQIGDKDVKTFDGDTLDVLNNTYNTTLGISAEYGDFTFGVAAKYGFGTDDRSNAGVKVNATYAF